MKFQFTKENIKEITDTIGSVPLEANNSWTWNINNNATGQKLIVSIYNDVDFSSNSRGAMVSIQSMHGFFELHNLTAFITFEPDEVIFIRHDDNYLSSLVIGKGATCSLFSNISRNMLKNDMAELDPTVLLSAMQLSIADAIISDK